MGERILNIFSLGIFRILGGALVGLGNLILGIGARSIFLWEVITKIGKKPFELREFILQLYLVGVRSLAIVAVSGFFVGGITVLQFHYALSLFGAQVYLGGVTTSGLLRQVGPVLVAIMITGRVGAFISAELGTMRASEQIQAVRCLGLDPVSVLVLPRFLAVVIMIFLLTIVGLLISLAGGALVSFFLLKVSISYYLVNLLKLTTIQAFLNGMVKSLLFGILIATISCYEGYYSAPSAEGVGKAVNRTLTYASISVFLVNYIITAIVSLTFTLGENILFLSGAR